MSAIIRGTDDAGDGARLVQQNMLVSEYFLSKYKMRADGCNLLVVWCRTYRAIADVLLCSASD